MYVFQNFSGGVTPRTPFLFCDPEPSSLHFKILAARLLQIAQIDIETNS